MKIEKAKKVRTWSKRSFDEEVFLPVRRVVCSRCRGNGVHVNPAIDGHGILPEEFREDPEFAESYFSGVYDVMCEECQGERVVDEIDEERCKTKLSWWKGLLRHWKYLDEKNASEQEWANERRWGA